MMYVILKYSSLIMPYTPRAYTTEKLLSKLSIVEVGIDT